MGPADSGEVGSIIRKRFCVKGRQLRVGGRPRVAPSAYDITTPTTMIFTHPKTTQLAYLYMPVVWPEIVP
uniref:Uncharacterized protein n=1 Tax=Romanomermis culicivorax TaxID=13658 RepID=A0A915KX99_ROMCU